MAISKVFKNQVKDNDLFPHNFHYLRSPNMRDKTNTCIRTMYVQKCLIKFYILIK